MPTLRTTLISITRWWQRRGKPRIKTASIFFFKKLLPEVVFPAGWFFITWGIFGTNARAWAISFGLLLFVLTGARYAEAYYRGRANAAQRSNHID